MGHVLTELEKAGHKMLASTLESGSVTLKGNEVDRQHCSIGSGH